MYISLTLGQDARSSGSGAGQRGEISIIDEANNVEHVARGLGQSSVVTMVVVEEVFMHVYYCSDTHH